MKTAVVYMRRRDFLMAAAGAVVGAGLFYLSRLATDTRPPAAAPAEGSGTVLEATERGFMVKGDINPVLRFSPGEQVSVELRNLLREETIVHWHGFKVDWRNDAHPVFAVKPGENYRYLFKVANKPGTYFYHPHPTASPLNSSTWVSWALSTWRPKNPSWVLDMVSTTSLLCCRTGGGPHTTLPPWTS
jgi:FtsP/CotA-like multicopper oxidase with cupredoxin domain